MNAPATSIPVEASALPPLWLQTCGLVLLGVATVVALIVGDGNPAVAIAPLAGVGFVLALWKAPLRTWVMLLIIAGLVLENPNERPASGLWRSPLYPLGALLLYNLNATIPIHALKFTGLDVIVGALFAIVLYRKAHGIRTDRQGQFETANVMGQAALASLATCFLLWGYGLATHGDFQQSLWQIQRIIYLPILFFLFQTGMKGPIDLPLLARILIGSAVYKALTAVWVRLTLHVSKEELPYVNTHSESMLYAAACTLLLASFALAPSRKALGRIALFFPIIGAGMIANNRRLVWVELAAVLFALFLMMPRNKVKRAVSRGAIMAMPLVVLYLAIGWNSGSKLFKPAQLVKSVVNSKSDRSTETRDVENFNLVWTLRSGSLLGVGFGHEYTELVKGDDIARFFPQYRYIPHNSLLGLWAFGGVLGFSGITLELVVAVFLGARVMRRAQRTQDRVAGFCVVAMVLVYLIQAYGDMGAFSWMADFLVAAALALVGKLAIATGAWPARRLRSRAPGAAFSEVTA